MNLKKSCAEASLIKSNKKYNNKKEKRVPTSANTRLITLYTIYLLRKFE